MNVTQCNAPLVGAVLHKITYQKSKLYFEQEIGLNYWFIELLRRYECLLYKELFFEYYEVITFVVV